MLRLAANTTKPAGEVIDAAVAFFGPDGTGLNVAHRAANQVQFEGGGGFVALEVTGQDGRNEVTAVTREWEADVRRFFERSLG
jgi:hypothetical protein